MTIITIKLLKDYDACEEGIIFFKNNFPESLFPDGLDLKNIRIKGDYEGYFEWLNNLPILEYDERERVVKEVYSSWFYISYEYDKNDNVIKKTYHSGKYVSFEYDGNSNLVKKIYSNGSYDSFEYDDNDNCVKEIFTYITLRYEYNENGDVTKKIYPSGNYIAYEYDTRRNLVKETFANGRVQKYIFEYDSWGRLIQVNDCYITYF